MNNSINLKNSLIFIFFLIYLLKINNLLKKKKLEVYVTKILKHKNVKYNFKFNF
jgi:hypothetical protein